MRMPPWRPGSRLVKSWSTSCLRRCRLSGQAGLAALVDVDRAAGLAARHSAADRDQADGGHADPEPAGFGLTAVAGIVALAALSSWLGARAVRTSYPAEVRQALDMTGSVRGIRPPARTVRGLA